MLLEGSVRSSCSSSKITITSQLIREIGAVLRKEILKIAKYSEVIAFGYEFLFFFKFCEFGVMQRS